jgi:hypothetical protein
MKGPSRKFDRQLLPITSAVAGALLASGCGPSNRADRDVAICRDSTGRRIADTDCQTRSSHAGGHGWYFIGRGRRVPAVGDAVRGGSFTPTPGAHYARAPAAFVSRGGFGFHGFGGG